MIEDNSKTFDKGQTNQTSYEAETLDAIRNQMSTPLRVVPDIDDLTIRTIIKLRVHFYSSLEPRYPEVHSLESFAEKTAIMHVIKESCEKYIKQYFSALYKELANHSSEDNYNPHSWLCTNTHIPVCRELKDALERQDLDVIREIQASDLIDHSIATSKYGHHYLKEAEAFALNNIGKCNYINRLKEECW